MKKKKIILIGVICAAVLIAVGFWMFYDSDAIRISSSATVVIYWSEDNTGSNSFTQTLTEAEGDRVREVLRSRKYSSADGELSCACHATRTITIGNDVFWLAICGCPSASNVTIDRYIEMSEEDWAILNEIFKKYGGNLD